MSDVEIVREGDRLFASGFPLFLRGGEEILGSFALAISLAVPFDLLYLLVCKVQENVVVLRVREIRFNSSVDTALDEIDLFLKTAE